MVRPEGVLFQTYRLQLTGDVFGFTFKIFIRVTTVYKITLFQVFFYQGLLRFVFLIPNKVIRAIYFDYFSLR